VSEEVAEVDGPVEQLLQERRFRRLFLRVPIVCLNRLAQSASDSSKVVVVPSPIRVHLARLTMPCSSTWAM
jgi:hypothetical protein